MAPKLIPFFTAGLFLAVFLAYLSIRQCLRWISSWRRRRRIGKLLEEYGTADVRVTQQVYETYNERRTKSTSQEGS